jgi:hypothetical protein
MNFGSFIDGFKSEIVPLLHYHLRNLRNLWMNQLLTAKRTPRITSYEDDKNMAETLNFEL